MYKNQSQKIEYFIINYDCKEIDKTEQENQMYNFYHQQFNNINQNLDQYHLFSEIIFECDKIEHNSAFLVGKNQRWQFDDLFTQLKLGRARNKYIKDIAYAEKKISENNFNDLNKNKKLSGFTLRLIKQINLDNKSQRKGNFFMCHFIQSDQLKSIDNQQNQMKINDYQSFPQQQNFSNEKVAQIPLNQSIQKSYHFENQQHNQLQEQQYEQYQKQKQNRQNENQEILKQQNISEKQNIGIPILEKPKVSRSFQEDQINEKNIKVERDVQVKENKSKILVKKNFKQQILENTNKKEKKNTINNNISDQKNNQDIQSNQNCLVDIVISSGEEDEYESMKKKLDTAYQKKKNIDYEMLLAQKKQIQSYYEIKQLEIKMFLNMNPEIQKLKIKKENF